MAEDTTYCQHAFDPLKNLSYFVSKCLCCGREHRESIVDEKPVAWIACSCGHVLRAEDRVRWH